ncbi:BACON domain-containing protein [Sphingobacterium sp. SGG-5]|uniref:DUF5689 domain-containing protein n=1 Tax=Sphingobacterium sp. SGG-5 TaxID=2710881 RepID=UPI0013EC62F3|nr:DUF5689 domain-containing protein [Sphingobacterium sp. SGG-5]NGM60433.1 BACON domain-containing protein [Sphingobacterium sp. SGG-5]
MLYKKYAKQMLSAMYPVASMFLLLLTIWGCSKELEVAETLEVSNLDPTVLAAGGAVSLDITSNASWKVGKIDVSWLHVENTAGEGDGQLRLSCDENDAVESRTVEFFVVTTKDGTYQKIVLTQLATDPFIEIGQNELEVGSRPRSHAVQLNTNIPAGAIRAEILYEEEAENWVVGVNVEDGTLKFQTTLNSLAEERVATIILSYEDISGQDLDVWDKITITQMASGNEPPSETVEFSYVKGLPLGEIVENISIIGNIVSTGTSDNFKKNTYIIQNGNSSAIAFEGIENLTFDKYDKVHLLLDGAQIETFEDCGVQYRVIRGISAANILERTANVGFTPPTMHISELTDAHLLSVVTLKDVEFAMPHGAYTNIHEYYAGEPRVEAYSDYATKHYPAPITDIDGDNMYLITNREVTYRRNAVPKGSGTITGVVVKIMDSAYGDLGQYSIRHLEESDIAINPNRANGFSEILVEWELPPTTGFPNGTPNLPATTGPASATLQKDEGTGFYSGNTLNGIYLIDKYRGDVSGSGTAVSKSCYNVNSWGPGRYWIMDNVSTLGITSSLSLQFEANSATTSGPRDFAVEYSLDGDNWTRIAAYQLTGQIAANVGQDVIAGFKVFTYRLPNELLNKPNIKIRLMNINNTSVTGGTFTSTTTSRLAHFSIKYNK